MTDDIEVLEGVVVEGGHELAIPEQRAEAIVQPLNLFGADAPEDVIARASSIATVLKNVVTAQGLVSTIQGKSYPHVEAWTALGSMLGVFPVTVWSRKTEDGQGWEARVEARTRAGELVGAGEAQCTRSEKTWNGRDDYALRAMAQTRATSRALRQPLGFVMVLAGYEATPEAEMPPQGSQGPSPGGSWGDPYPDRGDSGWGPGGRPADEPPPSGRPKPQPSATTPQKQKLAMLAEQLGWDNDRRHAEAGVESFTKLTKHEAHELIQKWDALVSDPPPVAVSAAPTSEAGGAKSSEGQTEGESNSPSGPGEHEHLPVAGKLAKYDSCGVEGCLKVRRKGSTTWA